MKKLIALLLVFVMLLTAVACGKKEPANADPETPKESNENISNDNDEPNADDETSSDPEEEGSSDEESTSDEDANDNKDNSSDKNNNSSSGNKNNNSGSNNNSSSGNKKPTATQLATATNPSGEEILGAGSKNEPYLEIPDKNFTVTTAKVPAGKVLYYSIYRVGGMILTINDANAYVVCDGKTYTAKNGKVSFQVPDGLKSDTIDFEIGNKGSSAKSFKLVFTNVLGSIDNPKKLDSISKDIKISLAAEDNDGYTYKYTAEKTGKIRFYMTATKDSMLSATVVKSGNIPVQYSTEVPEDVKTDSKGKEYIEVEVKKGEEITITVCALPNKRFKYPATEITWHGEYA